MPAQTPRRPLGLNTGFDHASAGGAIARRHGALSPDPRSGGSLRPILALADFAFAAFVILIASDAFVFLGAHSALWLAAYGYGLARIAMMLPDFLDFARDNLVFLAFPALCLASLLWSDTPADTLRFALQVTVSTLIALLIAMRLSLGAILWTTALVLTILMAASLANTGGAMAPPTNERGYFMGIFQSKNAFGHRAVIFVLLASFIVLALRRPGILCRIVFVIAIAATVWMVSISGSATAMVLTGTAAVGALIVHIAATRRSGPAMITLPLLAAVALASVGIAAFRLDPVGALFDALGKDATMTGRTVLWRFGLDVWSLRPAFGFGASGFWGHPAFAGDIAIIQARYGEMVHGFHSLPVELLVIAGPIGLVVHGAMGWAAVARAVRGFRMARHDPDATAATLGQEPASLAILAAAIVVTLYGMALIGPQLYTPHTLPLILLVAIGAALGKAKSRQTHHGAISRQIHHGAISRQDL